MWKGLAWKVQRDKAALSNETIMKRLVNKSDYVPSTATNELESSSALDDSEQICSICIVM